MTLCVCVRGRGRGLKIGGGGGGGGAMSRQRCPFLGSMASLKQIISIFLIPTHKENFDDNVIVSITIIAIITMIIIIKIEIKSY